MIIITSTLLSFVVSQALKIIIFSYKKEQVTLYSMISPGGMPSTHSALISGLTTSVALHNGLGSTEFAICVAISIIVIHDAIGTRQTVGIHAKTINAMGGSTCAKLTERIGHTPLEMIAGVVLGITVALLLFALS